MEQFFVMKKYRGASVGKQLALRVFAALPGEWEVGQMPDNTLAFWRAVIGKLTQGEYREHTLTEGGWQGYEQVFDTTATDR